VNKARQRPPDGTKKANPRTRTAAGRRKFSFVPAAREIQLRPRGEARGEADDDDRPPHPAFSGCPGIEDDRDSSQQEEDPDDVVAGLAGLIRENRQAQRYRTQRQRPRRHLVRPPDTPAGNQTADEPTDVQQRRQQVPPERQHSASVEQFRVGWVKPGQKLRRNEVQVPRAPTLGEPRGERPVVPGRIEPGHPRSQLRLHIETEPHKRCPSHGQRHHGHHRWVTQTRPGTMAARRETGVPVRRSGVHFFAPTATSDGPPATRRKTQQAGGVPPSPRNHKPKSQADQRNADETRHRLEQAEAAKKLSYPDQQCERDHSGRQMRWGAGERWKQASAYGGCAQRGEARE